MVPTHIFPDSNLCNVHAGAALKGYNRISWMWYIYIYITCIATISFGTWGIFSPRFLRYIIWGYDGIYKHKVDNVIAYHQKISFQTNCLPLVLRLYPSKYPHALSLHKSIHWLWLVCILTFANRVSGPARSLKIKIGCRYILCIQVKWK